MIRGRSIVISCLLICIFIVGAAWLLRKSQVVLFERLGDSSVSLEIRKKNSETLIITCHERPGFLFPIHELSIPPGKLDSFLFLSDVENDVFCAIDENDLGIIVLCTTEPLDWFVSGRSSGIEGSTQEFWSEKLQLIKSSFPKLLKNVDETDL